MNEAALATAAERDRLARLFANIASQAAVAVMEVYASDFETRTKADMSPVSDADERAEEIILKRLAKDLPGVPCLAEETCARIGAGCAGDIFVAIDPVDGTREFIKRNGEFTVNIALIAHGTPLAGCVLAPAIGDLYYAGASAWLETLFRAGAAPDAAAARPLVTRAPPATGMVAVTSSSHIDAQTRAWMARHRVEEQRGVGSSLKFGLIARGEADVYPRFGRTMEWDTAAGEAVLRAAGGVVLTPDGAPFHYGKDRTGYANDAFVAWGRAPKR